MPDWLADGDPKLPTLTALVARLVLAAALGFAVAAVHGLTLGRRKSPPALPATLVLLAVLVAFVMMAIGNSAARAFGLVGILSIVRFRTVVEDTRDTAFVIFAVAVGMGVGAGAGLLALVGVPVVGVVAALTAWRDGRRPPAVACRVTVRLGLGHEPAVIDGVLGKHFREVTPTGAGTAKQGGAVDLHYTAVLLDPAGATAAVADLNRTDGVQAAEVRAD
jgi:hypothetical protein